MLDQRLDPLVVLEGAHTLRQLLYEVFVEWNQLLASMGTRQWSAKLTLEQRQLMLVLPAATLDRASLASAFNAVVDAMRTTCRCSAVSCGCEWPYRLDDEGTRLRRNPWRATPPDAALTASDISLRTSRSGSCWVLLPGTYWRQICRGRHPARRPHGAPHPPRQRTDQPEAEVTGFNLTVTFVHTAGRAGF